MLLISVGVAPTGLIMDSEYLYERLTTLWSDSPQGVDTSQAVQSTWMDNQQRVEMYVVVWQPKHGRGGGHQVALTLDRAETIHRAVRRALPEAECRIEAVEGYVAPGEEQRPRRQEQRQPPRRASRRG
jgi:hypothetical protein